MKMNTAASASSGVLSGGKSDAAKVNGEKELESLTLKDADEDSDHPFKYSNDTSDLRLMVEGKPLYVSRVVLSLVSPVMKR